MQVLQRAETRSEIIRYEKNDISQRDDSNDIMVQNLMPDKYQIK